MFLMIYPTDLEPWIYTKAYKWMFIAAFFIIAKTLGLIKISRWTDITTLHLNDRIIYNNKKIEISSHEKIGRNFQHIILIEIR